MEFFEKNILFQYKKLYIRYLLFFKKQNVDQSLLFDDNYYYYH